MLPFTAQQFFAVFTAYNIAIWPAQVVAYVIGVVVACLALLGRSDGLVAELLAMLWLWTGIGYHALAFAAVNPAAYGFAALFVAEGALLAWFGAVRSTLHFRRPRSPARLAIALLLIGYAIILYPLIGSWTGHSYPAAPVFGVTPCPLTIFSFGVLLLAQGRFVWAVTVIPLVWAAIGGVAAVVLDVAQDWALPLSGILTATLILRGRRGAPRRQHVVRAPGTKRTRQRCQRW